MLFSSSAAKVPVQKTPEFHPLRDRKSGGATLIDAAASISSAFNAGLRHAFVPDYYIRARNPRVTGKPRMEAPRQVPDPLHKNLSATPALQPCTMLPGVTFSLWNACKSVLILFTASLYGCDYSAKQAELSRKIFPPVRLDAHSSIQPTPTFAKLALARSCVCIRSRVLLIWKWVANPMARLHCNSLHADKPLDCNRTGGKIFIFSCNESPFLVCI